MISKDLYRPCPFCGGTDFKIRYMRNGDYVQEGALAATICCKTCMARMSAEYEREEFQKLDNKLYRKVPERFAEEVLLDKWNTRWLPEPTKQRKKSNRYIRKIKNFLKKFNYSK